MGNHIYWDFLSLFEEMKNGIRLAVQKGYHVTSIGIDTWGVDFGLLDRAGICWEIPAATVTRIQKGLRKKYSKPCHLEHYRESGIQVMPINSLFSSMP